MVQRLPGVVTQRRMCRRETDIVKGKVCDRCLLASVQREGSINATQPYAVTRKDTLLEEMQTSTYKAHVLTRGKLYVCKSYYVTEHQELGTRAIVSVPNKEQFFSTNQIRI